MRLKETLTGLFVRAAQVLGAAVAWPLRGKTSARLRRELSVERSVESLRGMCSIRKAWKSEGFLMAMTARCVRLGFPLLLLFALLLVAVTSAQAAEKFCSEAPYNGVIDGNVLGTSPVQITIDTDCVFQNWPQSNPLTATINFQTNDPSIYLIVFDNVWSTGNMACSNIDHKLWIVNSEEGSFSGACQSIMIPAETIDKQVPASTATIGLPFLYTLTIPSMQFPAGAPSPNDLGNIRVTDDLTATGVNLTLLGSINAYYKGSGAPVPITNLGDSKHLDFSLPNLLAGQQIVVEVTVVLDDTPTNVQGTQFFNTATWKFSRWIDIDEDGNQDANEFFNPLPGESGISQTMTIAEPKFAVKKTSTTTALNVGDLARFTINAQNTGGSDAWNATILDKLPLGMCVNDPTATLSAKITAADEITLVKTLAPGTDYTLTYSGCDLTLTMTDAAGPIAPEQWLIITYQAQIDPLGSPNFPIDGSTLTNVAGATQWFSADSTPPHAGRRQYDKTLTDGTPAITTDHQASKTITAAMHGYFFEKTVQNLTSLANPATTAAPGDTLRYKLRVFNVDQNIKTITIRDQLDLNYFDPATFGIVSIVTGTSYSATSSFSPTGLLQVFGAPELNVDVRGQIVIEFDITLKSAVTGTAVSNQAFLEAVDFLSPSDDPYDIYGVASPDVPNDEYPTIVKIETPGALSKANIQTTATIGEQFEYIITVPATATSVPLYDVQIMDTLPANLRFVSARVVLGGAWTVINTGTGNSLNLKDTVTGIDIPANGRARIAITVEVLNSAPNQSSVFFNNTASYTYNRANGVDSTELAGGEGSTPNMTVVEPLLTANKTVSFVSPAGKPSTDPATVGDVIEYKVTITNSSGLCASTAFDTNIVDTLPANVALVAGSATATINGVAVTDFVVTPSTPSGATLVWGRENSDGNLDIPVGQSLVLTYQVTVVDASSVSSFTNSVYVDWTSLDEDYPIDTDNPAPGRERTGAGCPITTLPNDYCFGPASVTVITVDNTSIVKSFYADSYAETPPSTTDPIVRVGDTVTYNLTLNLQEYMTRNMVVEDTLPVGLAFDRVVSINGVTTSPFTPVAPFTYNNFTGPTVNGNTVTWSFGDIYNEPDGNSANDTLVIRYVAKVVTDAPAVGVGYVTSILLDNLAKLSYTGGDPADYPARLTTTERVDVRQPQMGAISKVDLGTGRTGAGTSADPYQVNIATDVMKFQLKSCNNGLAPAYNVQITDLLANQLDETSITTPVVAVGGTTLTAVTDYVYTPPAGRGGTMSFALSTPVDPGQCVTVDYNIGFHPDIAAGQTWNNSATLKEYWSLPANGRIYASSGPAQVWMTNQVIVQPLTKTLTSPTEATIGETVTYRITVPGMPVNAALSNVIITDTLNSVLSYGSATVAAPFTLTDNTAGQNVSLTIAQIPAGQQAVITLTARVANNDQANAGTSFTNTASYIYTGIPAGAVTSGTSGPLIIVEPAVTVDKTVVASATPPTAGNTLTYTVNLIAAPAPASNAYDLVLVDTLSLGLAYVTGTARISGVFVEPSVIGDGVSIPQTLTWSDLDITAGTTVTVTYDVLVNNDVVIGQTLTNTAFARWTSLNGDFAYERSGTGIVPNDYVASDSTTLIIGDNTTFVKVRVSDTYTDTDANVRIGDLIEYESRLGLQEGTHTNVSVIDTLPPGLQYVGMISATYFGTPGTATPVVGGQTITWNLGTVDNPSDGDSTNDVLVLRYRVRVLNNDAFAQTPLSQTLINNATLGYTVAGNPVTRPSTASVTVLQPTLTVSKSAAPAGGDTVINAGEVITYTVDMINSGAAPAYDTVLVDTLPIGLRQGGVTTISISLLTGGPLTNFNPSFDPVTGVASWNFDTGSANVYSIPAGDTLRVVYQVTADADLGPGLTLTNTAQATLYYSFDDEAVPANGSSADREVYGPTNTAQQTLTTPVPGGLLKQNPASTTATIGQEFTYTITVPAVPQATALHDVRILDNLGAVSANLTLVSVSKVSGSQTWTPVNTGTTTSLIIEDTSAGIEIPANEQIVVNVTVRMNNVDSNVAGLAFSNTASYTYNQIDGDAATQMSGAGNSTADMTVMEPSVTVTKSVNPATPPKAGDILTYTVNLTAASGANFSDAFDISLVDTLSLGLTYQAGTATVNGTGNTIADPTVNGDGNTTTQTLTWDLASSTADIDIVEGTTVAVTYQVRVLDTVSAGQTLTNSVTAHWTSIDGNSDYERTGSGTPPYNDYVATAAAPPLTIPIPTLTLQKNVDKPIANPGDRLRYTIVIQNPTGIRVENFSLVDVISPMFQLSGIENVVVPATVSYVINGGTLNVTGNIEANETLTIVFEAVLMTDLKSGAVVLNQAELSGPWPAPIKSDDDLNVLPVANPTQTVIPADGVVYDAVSRKPLGGVTLTILGSTGTALPASCFIDSSQQNQVTPASGTYKFDLNFSQPECPAGSDYLIAVTAVPAGYVAGPSLIIEPTSTNAYSVPMCSGDAIPTTTQCEAHVSTTAPTGAVTTYYLHLTLDSTANQIFNNHIPVDPYVEEKISITKTSPLINVTRGQLVPYTITFKNTLRSTLPPLGIVDTLPPGFKYVEGSSRFDGTPLKPAINGRQLEWNNLSISYNQQHTIKLLLLVGAGVSEGEYVNQAQVINTDTRSPFSEVAMATVRVVPDPTFDCTDVVGKVFDDRDLNGQQEAGERGLPGVRVVTARGLIATTDEHGRFHVTCAMVPDEIRGSNFILKLDHRTLPIGYRVTTENPRVQRATRGKMLRFNFGATIHHVVSMDIADGAFEPKSTKLRMQWQPRIDLLLNELRKAPSVLRLSYLADVENEGLVEKRFKALKKEITRKWDGEYRLTIETEVFWRRGSPP